VVAEGLEGDEMRKGPREWNPRGVDPEEALRKIIKTLNNSGQAEAIAISAVLESAMEQEDFDTDLAFAIFDTFQGWAMAARSKLKAAGFE
jgi:hypothetical protein